ncbi:MAG: hypothetical protein KA257_05680 [Opitutaceae bacterium]|nr:hypothetical protein [Opitutaceae bacterium]MBP9913753.1 hypothetical protein [Opitutaceae bacterium]
MSEEKAAAAADDATIIRQGVTAAIQQSLLPAAVQKAYPGHFTIVADGHWFGQENTWPGLDSWQMAGAYLLLGRTPLVLDYFDFVQATQRADGNIPFAVFAADNPPEHLTTYLKGVRYPEEVFTYDPKREGYRARKWVGCFSHWIAGINPLGTLAAVSYLLLGEEIFAATGDKVWLEAKLGSLEAAARYLLSRKSANGLIAGAGFYTEMPPRHQWDGVTQCYVVHAWRKVAALYTVLGCQAEATRWQGEVDTLAARFHEVFWRDDHFAEYVHPARGVVDLHGLSDVNWAAVAHAVATPAQADALWPRMMNEQELWYGGMPTLTVAKPFSYQEWEFFSSHEDVGFEVPVGPLYDVAAMGRVWFLEAQACLKRGETGRLREAVVKICQAGLANGGFWHERYHPLQSRKVAVTGPRGYCEYPAVLTRIVLGNPAVFGKFEQAV